MSRSAPRFDASDCLDGSAGRQLLDSLAIDSAGNVHIATLVDGGISMVSPDVGLNT